MSLASFVDTPKFEEYKKRFHSRKHIDESVAYVKQGNRNNFE
jgi:predicted PolB exonuclease-like 3'-5' exonuclease